MNRPSFEDSFGGTYLLVEPGSFNIGDEIGSGHPNEQPIVSVEISEPFFLGVRPVTQASLDSSYEQQSFKISGRLERRS